MGQPEGTEEGEALLQKKILVKLDPKALSLGKEISFLHKPAEHCSLSELGVEERRLHSDL